MRLLSVIGMMVLMYACCTAQVNMFPGEGGQVTCISKSSSESCAFEKAKEKADEYCKNRGKNFVFISEESGYQGMDKTAKGMIKGVSQVAGAPVFLDESEDYKVKMQFRCK
jgi:hypothetical protein